VRNCTRPVGEWTVRGQTGTCFGRSQSRHGALGSRCARRSSTSGTPCSVHSPTFVQPHHAQSCAHCHRRAGFGEASPGPTVQRPQPQRQPTVQRPQPQPSHRRPQPQFQPTVQRPQPQSQPQPAYQRPQPQPQPAYQRPQPQGRNGGGDRRSPACSNPQSNQSCGNGNGTGF
jgi:hypothetical protein